MLYKSTKPIFSPVLNEYVYFTPEGFNHIVFKNRREHARSSQILRFKLLPRAIKLITISTTYQEYEEIVKELEVKAYKKKILKIKQLRYWGVIAIIDDRKIKVILRKTGNDGQLQFWSIIPAWVTNKHRDNKLFSTMKGNPDKD